jgi:thiol:disulfide interchange protein
MGLSRSASLALAALATVPLVAPSVASADSKAAKPQVRGTIMWRSIAEGEVEAKKTGKPILYFFTAEWCSPCHVLEAEVFSMPEVAAQVQKDFVTIRVEDRMRETGRNSPEMLALAERYGLRGFPTLVVSRAGLAKKAVLEGWLDKETALEFVRTGKQRFGDLEKKSPMKVAP